MQTEKSDECRSHPSISWNEKQSNNLLLLNPYSKKIGFGEIICCSRDTKNPVLKKAIPGNKEKGNSTSKKPRKQ